MSWNYRIIRHIPEKGEAYLAVHEVFYDDDGEPDGCTENPIQIIGEDLEAIQFQSMKIAESVDKPILDYQMFLDMEGDKNV